MNQSLELVRTDPDSGRVVLRAGITIALFIAKRAHEISPQLIQLLDQFVENIPKDALKWVVPNANAEEWKPFTDQTLKRLRTYLAPAGAEKRKLSAFNLNDSGSAAPIYSFTLISDPCFPNAPDATTLVQITLPMNAVENNQKADECAAFVRRLVEIAQPISGYCSPGLQFSESVTEQSYNDMHALSARFPGYDIQFNNQTHQRIGQHVRGARWITIFGKEIAARLGGVDTLREKLAPPIVVEEVGACVAVRAGETPELGDINRKLDTPLLRQVARALEPVTLFRELDMLSNFANFHADVLQRWERRFLDPW